MDVVGSANLAPLSWTEDDLAKLIGQVESSRLEFKSGALFPADRQGKWHTMVSAEVSSFANSEGGLLVLGVAERKEGKANVASEIDGVPGSFTNRSGWLDLIQGSISPPLPGIKVAVISLSRPAGRVCVVAVIPAGVTAYQAKDHIYYGRSQDQKHPLADHDVRMRIQRGRIPSATVEVVPIGLEALQRFNFGDQPWEEELEEEVREDRPDDDFIQEGDMVRYFKLAITNTGDTTIRDLSLRIELCRFGRLSVAHKRKVLGHDLGLEQRFRPSAGTCVFPAERIWFPEGIWTVFGPGEAFTSGGRSLAWTLYLDDARPMSGTIELAADLFRLAEPRD